MTTLPRPLSMVGAATACSIVLLSGCTSTKAEPVTTPSSASSASTAASPSTSESPSVSPSTASDAVIITVTIADQQVSPNGEKINVTKGQTVVLNVTSDTDDEIHAHNGGDGYELEVTAGRTATGRFVATDTGSFEVESHQLEKTIVTLVVR